MQLKRNKEMEFETLKKSHKKQIIIGALAVCVIGGTLTFNLTRAKYKVTESIPLVKGTVNYKAYDFKIMAMYKSDDGSNYNEINVMPESGYVINEEKTYCTTDNKTQVKGKIKTVNGIHGLYNISKSDKCYLYFDKKTSVDNVNDLLAKVQSEAKTTTPDFSVTATTDEGVYSVSDPMHGGTSYYWRGAATTNYVKFAGFCWRIVRINGDKTMRLIYDGTTCHANGTNDANSIAAASQAYNASRDRSEYVGWTYSAGSQRTTGGTASNIKSQTDTWYSSNITGTNADKVADGKFCNDRNIGSGYSWSSQPSSKFYYAGNDRSGEKSASSVSPTLSCSSGDVYIMKAGAITMDEVVMAGGKWATANSSYYLYNGQYYWAMSPYWWTGGYAGVFVVATDGSLVGGWVNSPLGLRPVINLRSDVAFKAGGNGTKDNPYVVN